MPEAQLATPVEVSAYAARVPMLDTGQPGKEGLLRATLAVREGVTRLTQAYAQAPCHDPHAIYVDPADPAMAYLYLISLGGGILQGDRIAMRIEAEAGARVHVTTPSATKVYKMEHDYATQHVELVARRGALLEWLPEPLIPFGRSRLYQQADLYVEPEATLIYGEVMLPGRKAMGEEFAYEVLYNRVKASGPEGRLLHDAICLEPKRRRLSTVGLLGPHDVMGSLYILTQAVEARPLADLLHDATQGGGLLAGASTLPRGAGVLVRIVGESNEVVSGAIQRAWDLTRRELTGRPAPDLRKY